MSPEVVSSKEITVAPPLLVEVLGPVGVGKTALAQLIKNSFGASVFEEKYPASPYLEEFYKNPQGFSFLSECFFLGSKIEQLKQISSELKTRPVVLDPGLWQDKLFAMVHHELGWMTDGEYQWYLSLCQNYCVQNSIPAPDLIISVHAPVEVVLNRIRERNRPYEMVMLERFPQYFQLLVEKTAECLKEIPEGTPVLEIDSGKCNYLGSNGVGNLRVSLEIWKAIRCTSLARPGLARLAS